MQMFRLYRIINLEENGSYLLWNFTLFNFENKCSPQAKSSGKLNQNIIY